MSHNNYNYCLSPVDQLSEIAGMGVNDWNISTDGLWAMGDKGDQEMYAVEGFDADSLPQYMKDLGVDSCCLSHEEALALCHSVASEKGASDGWVFPEEI